MPFARLLLPLLLAPLACSQLNTSVPVWQQQVFAAPLSARTGASGLVVNGSLLAFVGGVPSAAATTQACVAASGAPTSALQTLLALSPYAPLGSSATQAAPEAPLASPLTLATAASAPLPSSAAGRLVTFSSASSEVLLWEGGALAPAVCAAPASPRPLPRASAGLVWLRSCNATSAAAGAPPTPCFVLYGGTLASGAVAGDMWFLYGAEAPLAAPPACAWVQATGLTGAPLPPLTQFTLAATPSHSEAVLYGGLAAGGLASASVFRFSPLGFRDADPDSEMDNLAQPHDGLLPFAWQSSVAPPSLGWEGYASRAIDNARYPDGNVRTGYFESPKTCSHTAPGDSNPWWGLDLGASLTINALRLYQRTDCCIGRFAGMAVYLSNSNASAPGVNPWAADGVLLPLTSANLLTAAVLFPVPDNTTARYVWLSLPGPGRYVTLCEVQVLRRRVMGVRDLAAPRNVALNAPTYGLFTNAGNAGGGGLLANAVDGVVTGSPAVRTGNSFVRINGPVGPSAAAQAAATPYLGIDLQGVFSLTSLAVYPALQPAANSRVSVYAGATRDFNYMQRCWGPGDIGAGVPLLGVGGANVLAGCAGLSGVRYVALARQLVNSPPPLDSNNLWVNEVQVLAAAQGRIPSMGRYGAAAARWGGFLWVFGGISGATGAVLGDLQVFDLAAYAWLAAPPVPPLGSAPPPRAFGALVALPPQLLRAPSAGLALFGGAGLTGDAGDLTLLAFPQCPPISVYGTRSITCEETGTVCTVVCLPTWTPTNPGTGNVLTCGMDGTWGMAITPACSGVVAQPPETNVGPATFQGYDASGRGLVAATWKVPRPFQYLGEGFRPGFDNPGGDFVAPFPSTFTGTTPAFPDLGRSALDFPLCWRKCNETVGCIAWAYRNRGTCAGVAVGLPVAQGGAIPDAPPAPLGCSAACPGRACLGFHCWLKDTVKPWTSLPERTSGDMPNPLTGYRVTAVPKGLTDYFPGTAFPLGNATFTAARSSPTSASASAVYAVSGQAVCGGSVAPTAGGGLQMDHPSGACACSLEPLRGNCLTVARAWPEASVAAAESWVVEAYIATPAAQINSLLAASQSLGLGLFRASAGGGTVPVLFAGLSGTGAGSVPAVDYRTVDFTPSPYAGAPAAAAKRSTLWSPLGVHLRLEHSSVGDRVRLGFRATASDVWSYHPWLAASALYGGSPFSTASGLRIGFVLSNSFPVTDNRITMTVSSLSFTAISAGDVSRGCPSIGPAMITRIGNLGLTGAPPIYTGPNPWQYSAVFPGLQPSVGFTLSVQALTAAGFGQAGYLPSLVTVPPPTPPSLYPLLVDAQRNLSTVSAASSSAPAGPTTPRLAIDGLLGSYYQSSGAGDYPDFGGERLTIDLGQTVSVYNLSLAAGAAVQPLGLREFQVIIHSTPADYVKGLDTGIWGALGGASPPVAFLPIYPPRRGRYVTVRNGAAAGAGLPGAMLVNELRVLSLSSCPAYAGNLTVPVAGNCGAGAPLGANCTLACASPALAPVSGSPTAVCTGDSWSATPLVCAPLCAPLVIPSDLASCSATIFADAFAYTPNDGSLPPLTSPPTSTPSGAWLALDSAGQASGWGGAWTLQSGTLTVNTLACASDHVMVMPAPSLAVTAGANFGVSVAVATGSAAGLVWGAQDILNYYRAYMAVNAVGGGGVLLFERVLAGAVTLLASTPVPALNAYATYTMALAVTQSTNFLLTLNGGLAALRCSDASPALLTNSAPEYFGLYASQDATFDSFAVTTSCFPGGIAAAQTIAAAPGTALALRCAPGFAPPFAPFTYTCASLNASAPAGAQAAALLPATPPSCQLAPPVFNPQTLYVKEGASRGALVGPDPLKGSSLSPAFAVDWSLNIGATAPARLQGAFTVSPCSGQVSLLKDGAVGPDSRLHANISLSVTAAIAGFPSSSVTRAIPVVVQLQDQPPSLFASAFAIPENSGGGLAIGTPSFFDWDLNWTASVPPAWYTYSWAWSDASGGLLVIDAATGLVSTAPGVQPGQLNYETLLPTHTFGQITRITQVNQSSYTSTAIVSVELLDANDPPTLPAGQLLGVTDERAASSGTLNAVLVAVDEDVGVWAGGITFELVTPAAIAAYNATPPAGLLAAQLAQVARCAAITLLPTVDGTAAGAPLFTVNAAGNVSVGASAPTGCTPGACILPSPFVAGWRNLNVFQDPSGVLMRAHYQLCANATDAFGAWGVGVVDVWVSVSATGLSTIPVISGWACSGPSVLDSASGLPVAANSTAVWLPTAGGVSGDTCLITVSSMAPGDSFTLALQSSPGAPAAVNIAHPGCVLVSGAPATITCTPQPGAGAQLRWFLVVNSAQQAFDQSNAAVAYAPPTVTQITASSGPFSALPLAGGATLTLTGSSFGPPGTPLSFSYGTSPLYPCALLPSPSSQSTAACTVPPGCGSQLPWTLSVAGQAVSTVSGTNGQQLLGYTSGVLTALRTISNASGAVVDALPDSRGNFPALTVATDGSDSVYIVGSDLGGAPTYALGGSAATATPLTPVTCALLPPGQPCPCPALAASCWAFTAPPGAGPSQSLQVFSCAQPASPQSIAFAYAPPVVTAILPSSPPPPGDPVFPTEGGVPISLTGRNFGPQPSGLATAVSFAPRGTDPLLGQWLPCPGLSAVSNYLLTCVLPQGSGARWDVLVSVGGVAGVSPGLLSYDPPAIFSAVSSDPGSPTLVPYIPPGSSPNATSTVTLSVLRGPAAGGAVITLTGINFGLNNATPAGGGLGNIGSYATAGGGSAQQYSNCVFLTWAQRPASTPAIPRLHDCNGGEDWLGEGEVPVGNILAWSHRQIIFTVPPGLGQREIQLVVGGAALLPPRTPNATSSAAPFFTAMTSPPSVQRFWYSDPIVLSLRACKVYDFACTGPLPPPALVGTDSCAPGAPADNSSCTLLRLDGLNFGPTPMAMSPNPASLPYPPPSPAFANALPLLANLESDAFFPPLPLALAPNLPTAFPVVQLHRSCIAYGYSSQGTPAPATTTVAMPLGVGAVYIGPGVGSCQQSMVAVSDSTILFLSAPGVGVQRSASVTVVSDGSPSGQQASAAPAGPILFSYAPPVITGFSPSIVPLGSDIASAAQINLFGRNFGNDENAVSQAWTLDERTVSGYLFSTSGPQLPFVNNCTRSRQTDTSGRLVTVLTCGVSPATATAGIADVQVRVAGQFADTRALANASKLTFACLQGYYGRSGEVCLPCPAGNDNPSLVGAECSTPHPGRAASPDPLNFLAPPPPCCASTCALTQDAASGLLVPTPLCAVNANISDAERFLYPRPLKGWYNLNASDFLTRGMAASCPPQVAASTAPRDVCIVPCSPASACLGDNACAFGYVSTPPSFRCASCAPGFFASAGTCAPCPSSPAAIFVVFALLVVACAVAGYWLNKHQVNIAMLSIGVDFFQVLAIFASSGVQWPPAVRQLLLIMSAFNLNIEIVAPECLVPKVTWGQKFLAIMALPLVVGSMLLLVFAAQAGAKWARGIRERKKLFSHIPAAVSSTLVLLYLLYLYLTRTALDVFNCAPTIPEDGKTYLQVVFEDCELPGGIRQTLWPYAVLGLLVYTFGYPIALGHTLYAYRVLAMEDQLLRAKGVGNDQLSNPHALRFRQMFGRNYYQFKPECHLWVLAVVGRKLCIAFSAIMFNRSVNFQMAACLLIIFLAYAAQVQVRPYMSPSECSGVLEAHEALALKGDPLHNRLKSAIAGIDSMGRKKGVRRELFKESGQVDPNALLVMMREYAFNFNTVEATMLFCIVIVCLMAVMYNANVGSSYYPQATDSITSVTLLTIVFGITYFFAALCVEVAAMDSCQRRRKGGAGSTKVLRSMGDAPVVKGPIDQSFNPMFLTAEGQVASVGSTASVVETLLGQAEAPPRELWSIFKGEFGRTLEALKTTQGALAEMKKDAQRVAAFGGQPALNPRAATGGAGGVRRYEVSPLAGLAFARGGGGRGGGMGPPAMPEVEMTAVSSRLPGEAGEGSSRGDSV